MKGLVPSNVDIRLDKSNDLMTAELRRRIQFSLKVIGESESFDLDWVCINLPTNDRSHLFGRSETAPAIVYKEVQSMIDLGYMSKAGDVKRSSDVDIGMDEESAVRSVVKKKRVYVSEDEEVEESQTRKVVVERNKSTKLEVLEDEEVKETQRRKVIVARKRTRKLEVPENEDDRESDDGIIRVPITRASTRQPATSEGYQNNDFKVLDETLRDSSNSQTSGYNTKSSNKFIQNQWPGLDLRSSYPYGQSLFSKIGYEQSYTPLSYMPFIPKPITYKPRFISSKSYTGRQSTARSINSTTRSSGALSFSSTRR